jgi:hypothetical protein
MRTLAPATMPINAETTVSATGKGLPMTDQTPAFLFFLSPFALLWLAFAIAETRKILAALKGGRHGR